MPGSEVAQYGIGFFAVSGVVYIAREIIIANRNKGEWAEIVQNNTRAMEKLANILQVSMARQEAKIDEIVAYVRSMK